VVLAGIGRATRLVAGRTRLGFLVGNVLQQSTVTPTSFGNRMQKKHFRLTEQTFNGLLGLFDPDPQLASERYQTMQSGLERFFENRGISCAANLVDKTMDIVARRLSEGESIGQDKVTSYFYSVARKLCSDYFRGPGSRSVSYDDLPVTRQPNDGSFESDEIKEERALQEARLSCLDRCLDELPPEQRGLILSYYEGECSGKIENRHEIARVLGLSLGTLRLRTHRIREKLEKCLLSCLGVFKE
jgi:RNA polymerase sigma factor (sigma-70 family)